MTHLLQPLDLTVNKVAKDFTKKKFWERFSRQISNGLGNEQELEDIEINYHLSVLKPLHETWLVSLYDYISSPEDKVVIASRWRKSGIFNAAELGLSKLRVFDSFNDICPLMEVIPPKETLSLTSLFPQELESYKTKVVDETDENEFKWEADDADEDSDTNDECDHDVGNTFDILGDE